MTAKHEAEQNLQAIVSLAESIIAKARAAQEAVANIEAPPEQKETL